MLKSNLDNNFWNQIESQNSEHYGIATYGLQFYSEMIQKTVVSLIDTGIVKHLIDTHVMNIVVKPKYRKQPEPSSFQDLLIIFVFWIVCCGFSTVAFAIENCFNTKIFNKVLKFVFETRNLKFMKFEFEKVHNANNSENPEFYSTRKLTLSLVKIFRKPRRKPRIVFENSNAVIVAVDVHRDDLEENLNVFGEKITQEFENEHRIFEILQSVVDIPNT